MFSIKVGRRKLEIRFFITSHVDTSKNCDFKTGVRFFVLFSSRFGEVNADLLMFHVLLTLKPFYKKPFELVIDCTHANTENRFKVFFCCYYFKL